MLNPQQQEAVHYIDGPLLVIAGAGSGKTRVITQKIAYLIETCGYNPHSVFAVTFTNKAAREMLQRAATMLPAKRRRGLQISTFHTLGLSMIKKNVEFCGLKPKFSIFDAEDALQVIKGLIGTGRANDKEYLFKVQQQLSSWKSDLLSPEEVFALDLKDAFQQEAALYYPGYQTTLKAYNAVDFDDLIRLPVFLLKEYPEVLHYWQNRIRHLLIDEYQDSNVSQYELVKLLVGREAKFTVVGDDDQSIYAWRGAKPENLGQLQHDFPRLKVIKLEQNYRSMGRILQVANQLIANNTHLFSKRLWSNLGHGDLLRVVICRDEIDEAEQTIADLVTHKLRMGAHFGQYAILYRGNHQARLFEKILRQQGIPYRISGGQSWFAKVEIKDIFAYLKLLCNADDDASFLRIINTPKRGIGESTLLALGNYAREQGYSLFACADHLGLTELVAEKPREALLHFKQWFNTIKQRLEKEAVVDVLKDLVTDSSYEAHLYEQTDSPAKAQKKMENVWELLDWIGRLLEKRQSDLADVINTLILIDILEQSDEEDEEKVQLMTLHASKGLEFPFVYMVGMEEELLPHKESIESNQIEEERRLAYVGITRAQKGLCMTLAKQRRKNGSMQECQPSRFLEELPQSDLEWFGVVQEKNEERSKAIAKEHLQGIMSRLTTA